MTPVAAVEPNLTAVAPVNPVPVMVTVFPPPKGPETGTTVFSPNRAVETTIDVDAFYSARSVGKETPGGEVTLAARCFELLAQPILYEYGIDVIVSPVV